MGHLTHTTQIRVAFHPNPEHHIIHGNWNVVVEAGPLGYLTADGQKHEI